MSAPPPFNSAYINRHLSFDRQMRMLELFDPIGTKQRPLLDIKLGDLPQPVIDKNTQLQTKPAVDGNPMVFPSEPVAKPSRRRERDEE